MPHRLKSLGDTAKIAHAVVNDGDHVAFLQDAEKVTLLTRLTQARRDAPVPVHRSRLIEILNVPHSESKLSWQLGVGG
jgi:hypothetical protein